MELTRLLPRHTGCRSQPRLRIRPRRRFEAARRRPESPEDWTSKSSSSCTISGRLRSRPRGQRPKKMAKLLDQFRRSGRYTINILSGGLFGQILTYETLTSILLRYFLKNGPNPVSFRLFLFFSHDKYGTNLTKKDISIDGLLGTGTQGGAGW